MKKNRPFGKGRLLHINQNSELALNINITH